MVHAVSTGSAALAGAALIWVALAAAATTYLMAVRRGQRAGRSWSTWRMASFMTGIGLLALALSPPMTAWAHHDLRGHMVQHLLIGMLAPLGLVLGAPMTLLLRTLPVPAARRVTALLHRRAVRWGTHPLAALMLDAGALYLLYLTPLFALSLTSPAMHGAIHIHFLAAGYLFTWSIAGPDPPPARPPFRTRLGVLFLAIAAHSTLAKLMYAYQWPRGTPHDPGQIRAAAQIMYYGGDFAELLLAIALFAAWYRRGGRRVKAAEGWKMRDRGEIAAPMAGPVG